MKGDMTRFQAHDLILRLVWRCVMPITIYQKGRVMNGRDPPFHMTNF